MDTSTGTKYSLQTQPLSPDGAASWSIATDVGVNNSCSSAEARAGQDELHGVFSSSSSSSAVHALSQSTSSSAPSPPSPPPTHVPSTAVIQEDTAPPHRYVGVMGQAPIVTIPSSADDTPSASSSQSPLEATATELTSTKISPELHDRQTTRKNKDSGGSAFFPNEQQVVQTEETVLASASALVSAHEHGINIENCSHTSRGSTKTCTVAGQQQLQEDHHDDEGYESSGSTHSSMSSLSSIDTHFALQIAREVMHSYSLHQSSSASASKVSLPSAPSETMLLSLSQKLQHAFVDGKLSPPDPEVIAKFIGSSSSLSLNQKQQLQVCPNLLPNPQQQQQQQPLVFSLVRQESQTLDFSYRFGDGEASQRVEEADESSHAKAQVGKQTTRPPIEEYSHEMVANHEGEDEENGRQSAQRNNSIGHFCEAEDNLEEERGDYSPVFEAPSHEAEPDGDDTAVLGKPEQEHNSEHDDDHSLVSGAATTTGGNDADIALMRMLVDHDFFVVNKIYEGNDLDRKDLGLFHPAEVWQNTTKKHAQKQKISGDSDDRPGASDTPAPTTTTNFNAEWKGSSLPSSASSSSNVNEVNPGKDRPSASSFTTLVPKSAGAKVAIAVSNGALTGTVKGKRVPTAAVDFENFEDASDKALEAKIRANMLKAQQEQQAVELEKQQQEQLLLLQQSEKPDPSSSSSSSASTIVEQNKKQKVIHKLGHAASGNGSNLRRPFTANSIRIVPRRNVDGGGDEDKRDGNADGEKWVEQGGITSSGRSNCGNDDTFFESSKLLHHQSHRRGIGGKRRTSGGTATVKEEEEGKRELEGKQGRRNEATRTRVDAALEEGISHHHQQHHLPASLSSSSSIAKIRNTSTNEEGWPLLKEQHHPKEEDGGDDLGGQEAEVDGLHDPRDSTTNKRYKYVARVEGWGGDLSQQTATQNTFTNNSLDENHRDDLYDNIILEQQEAGNEDAFPRDQHNGRHKHSRPNTAAGRYSSSSLLTSPLGVKTDVNSDQQRERQSDIVDHHHHQQQHMELAIVTSPLPTVSGSSRAISNRLPHSSRYPAASSDDISSTSIQPPKSSLTSASSLIPPRQAHIVDTFKTPKHQQLHHPHNQQQQQLRPGHPHTSSTTKSSNVPAPPSRTSALSSSSSTAQHFPAVSSSSKLATRVQSFITPNNTTHSLSSSSSLATIAAAAVAATTPSVGNAAATSSSIALRRTAAAASSQATSRTGGSNPIHTSSPATTMLGTTKGVQGSSTSVVARTGSAREVSTGDGGVESTNGWVSTIRRNSSISTTTAMPAVAMTSSTSLSTSSSSKNRRPLYLDPNAPQNRGSGIVSKTQSITSNAATSDAAGLASSNKTRQLPFPFVTSTAAASITQRSLGVHLHSNSNSNSNSNSSSSSSSNSSNSNSSSSEMQQQQHQRQENSWNTSTATKTIDQAARGNGGLEGGFGRGRAASTIHKQSSIRVGGNISSSSSSSGSASNIATTPSIQTTINFGQMR